MRVGAFRRITALLFDIIPLIVICSLIFNYLGADLIKPDGYDEIKADYDALADEYYDKIAELQLQYEDGEISDVVYVDQQALVLKAFNRQAEEYVMPVFMFEFVTKTIYYITTVTLLYYFYSLAMKGRTVGRRIMKIELGGKVTWWTLLLHEVIWKTGYWMLTLFVGGITLDIIMISFSRKKQAPRDLISGVYVKYEGVEYV